jgi:hypothetical protein
MTDTLQASIPGIIFQLGRAETPDDLMASMRQVEYLKARLLYNARAHISADEHPYLVPYLILDDETPKAIMVISPQAKSFADDPFLEGNVATTYMDQHLIGLDPFLVADDVPYYRLDH